MQLESIDDLASRDLKHRGLQPGDYGLKVLSSDGIAAELGYHVFTRASYGIGIPYPSGRIGNIRLGVGHTGSKYNSVPSVTRNEVYWLGNESSNNVLVVEGEFKAIIAHKAMLAEGLDLLIIALPGVDNWVGTQHQMPIHPHFQSLVQGKKVTVCFDYDGTDIETPPFTGTPKPQVLSAERKLMASLEALGSEPRSARVGVFLKGADPRDKYAIDDHILGGGKLASILQRTTPYSIGRVVDEKDPSKKTRCSFAEAEAYALAAYGLCEGEIVDLRDGSSLQKTKALDQWGAVLCREVDERDINPLTVFMKKERCARFKEWVYEPTKPFGLLPGGRFNLFRMWDQGVAGDPGPWLNIVGRILRGLEVEQKFFHDWVAYIVQNPGKKNYTYLALVSPENGSGKSLLCETVIQMLGIGGIEMNGENLFNRNNFRLQGKVLVLVNELSSDKSKHVNEFKAMVTSDTITLEEKYRAARSVPNILNFMITSNEVSPVLVDRHSRRDAIIRLRPNSLAELKELFVLCSEFVAWRDNGGLEIIRGFYENYDLSGYNPKARAPETRGLADARELSKSDAMLDMEAVEDFIKDFGLPVLLAKEHVQMICGDDVRANQVFRLLVKQIGGGESRVVLRKDRTTVRCRSFGDVESVNKSELLERVDKATGLGV